MPPSQSIAFVSKLELYLTNAVSLSLITNSVFDSIVFVPALCAVKNGKTVSVDCQIKIGALGLNRTSIDPLRCYDLEGRSDTRALKT
jgi:hypothetical protein